jgi:hypothetical protein
MDGERYVGERRALRHFLQELSPLVVAALGPDSVLRYRIERALQSGDLAALRKAREIFHNQPEDLKRRLMRGIFEAPAQRPTKSGLLERYNLREPEPFVRFDAYPAATAEGIGLSVELDHELADDVPVRVLISPGTLPRSAAEALRHIAAWVERDRRLLSPRHWESAVAHGEDMLDPAALDDAKERHGGNLDQA